MMLQLQRKKKVIEPKEQLFNMALIMNNTSQHTLNFVKKINPMLIVLPQFKKKTQPPLHRTVLG